jgi:hypothetical protein
MRFLFFSHEKYKNYRFMKVSHRVSKESLGAEAMGDRV